MSHQPVLWKLGFLNKHENLGSQRFLLPLHYYKDLDLLVIHVYIDLFI